MVRLILAYEQQLLRDGIKALLEKDEVKVTGEAATGKELLALLATAPADMVLLDSSMPDLNGLQALSYLRQHHPDLKIILLSALNNQQYVHQVMELGASGYLLKNTGEDELRIALRLIAGGTSYISSNVTMGLLRKTAQAPVAPGSSLPDMPAKSLSKRELEVLKLISDGYTNAEIADILFTSKRTIETHRQNLLEKTQAKNTAALIKYAMLSGLIT